jgi:hypothetical protein
MPEKSKEKAAAGKTADVEVRFKCRVCGQEKPILDMRTVNRFSPVLIVCKDCNRTLR